MSKIFEATMDEKQAELEFNEKEMLAFKKYEEPIEQIKRNPFPKVSQQSGSNYPDNVGSMGFWLD